MRQCQECGKQGLLLVLDEYGRCIECSIKNPIATSNSPKCPKCKSENLQYLGENKKSFSAGKAIVGAALTGGVGLLAGFAGKKKGYDVLCGDCGHRFIMK